MKKRRRQKPKTSSISKPTYAGIPEDIIIIILTFLPVKTLIRFRCVCKSWFNLISTPIFIQTHLSKSNNFTLFLRHSGNVGYYLKSCSFSSRSSVGFRTAVKVDHPNSYTDSEVSIVGSCHGLLCIAIQDFGLRIFNLSTRISRDVLVWDTITSQFNRLKTYGFGYDVLNDDYKLVLISTVREYWVHDKQVKIYSLKTGLWRKIREFPYGIPSLNMGKYVNGVLHWSVVGTDDSSMVIVTLDLGNETYGEIGQPCYGDRNISSLSLGLLKGCLSIFSHYENSCCDIWIMKEYGVKDTWMKLYTIPYDNEQGFSFYSPLCICISGEILLEFGKHLYLYNPANGGFRNAKIRNLPGTLQFLESTTSVESLVSPTTLG